MVVILTLFITYSPRLCTSGTINTTIPTPTELFLSRRVVRYDRRTSTLCTYRISAHRKIIDLATARTCSRSSNFLWGGGSIRTERRNHFRSRSLQPLFPAWGAMIWVPLKEVSPRPLHRSKSPIQLFPCSRGSAFVSTSDFFNPM